MIKNYILTSFRSLIKHRSFSIINIFGLSISMAVCMLIILILQDQLSYDNFHKNRDRIYRIQSKDNLTKTSITKYASTTWPLAKELKDNYPSILLPEAMLRRQIYLTQSCSDCPLTEYGKCDRGACESYHMKTDPAGSG